MDSDLYCLQSDNGREIWRAEAQEGSQIMARPRVFEGEDWKKVVYAIETQNGRVRQYDLYSGLLYWDYSCADISNETCQDAVEAEFAIAPSGNTVYYGDIYGRINSLEVANFVTEIPTIAPSSPPTTRATEEPTISPAPTVAIIPTEMPQVEQDASNPTDVPEESTGSILIIDGDIEQQVQQDGGNDNNDSGAVSQGTTSSNAETSVIVDQQAIKGDSNKIATYVGATITGLCVLMIPLIIFSMLRRRRKKSASGKDNMAVEIIDDCSSDDVESQADLDYFNSIETNNSCDPNNGDGIEIEIINHSRGNPTKQKKKRKKSKGSLPDTPNTVKSLESIDEIPDDASAKVVAGEEYDVADPSVEAVNLRQSFDKAVASLPLASGSTVLKQDSVDDPFYFSDDDVPPPPPLEEEVPESPSSNELTWNTLLQVETSQSSKKLNSSSQISLKKPKESARAILPSHEESSTSMSIGGQKVISTDEQAPVQKETPLKKFKWRKIKKNHPSSSLDPEKDSAENEQVESPTSMNEEDESQVSANEELNGETATEQAPVNSNKSEETEEVTEEAVQTPASPSTYSMLADALQSLTPVRSVQSSSKSVGSDDESLYTSYTGGMPGGTPEQKHLSPLSNYVYDQDILRRSRSDIANEERGFLAQPVLSKSNAVLDIEEHPDDEITSAPANQYLSDETNGHRYGKSVRSKRDSNPFQSSSNSSGNEVGHTPIALMYDQLAAIGQQRREERKPAFKRRNKRMERENVTPPPQQQEKQEGDTWGNFLNELAEAEKEFFSPSASNSKSLLNGSGSEDIEEA